MHVSELYSFIDVFASSMHIYTHAVLFGATDRSTVKLSKCYIRLFS